MRNVVSARRQLSDLELALCLGLQPSQVKPLEAAAIAKGAKDRGPLPRAQFKASRRTVRRVVVIPSTSQ